MKQAPPQHEYLPVSADADTDSTITSAKEPPAPRRNNIYTALLIWGALCVLALGGFFLWEARHDDNEGLSWDKKQQQQETTTTASHHTEKESEPLPTQEQQQQQQQLIDDYRWKIAAISWELMQQDTNHAANLSQTIDITPYVDLMEEILDTVGVYGVYESTLLAQRVYADTITHYAHLQGHTDFESTVEDASQKKYGDKEELHTIDINVPNDRPDYPTNVKHTNAEQSWYMGCWWWICHWAGAITANKLVTDGHIYVGYSQQQQPQDSNTTTPSPCISTTPKISWPFCAKSTCLRIWIPCKYTPCTALSGSTWP